MVYVYVTFAAIILCSLLCAHRTFKKAFLLLSDRNMDYVSSNTKSFFKNVMF